MVTINNHGLLAIGMPIEGREFTRYFSGFPITMPDQEVICYHKKQIVVKHRKDIGSGMEVFMRRGNVLQSLALEGEKSSFDNDVKMSTFIKMCTEYGQLMIRRNKVQCMQVHIPLTGERM